MASLEDDLETAEDRREEAERALSEAQARVTRLESALDDEGVDEKRWR
jgi:predicted  nucleic acid-binding Zn-ribbon protein